MSIPGGEGMPEGSKRFLSNGPNRFNVAVSRARRLLHVFADSSWAQRSGVRHIEELRRSCERSAEAQLLAAQSPFRQDLVGPVWEPQLAEAMQRAGIPFHQQYPACGRFLDFAIFGTSLKLNVEVDGESFHRTAWGDRKTADLDRDQALTADGWTVLRFWVYQLREDMEGCVQLIQKRMQEGGR
jgi:very-short-patch-repair endonuclease